MIFVLLTLLLQVNAVDTLSAALSKLPVTRLLLSRCGLGNAQLKILLSRIPDSLHVINLSNNHFERESIGEQIKILHGCFSHLVFLELLAIWLAKCKSLQSLLLANDNIDM
jgi:hypothetical protein